MQRSRVLSDRGLYMLWKYSQTSSFTLPNVGNIINVIYFKLMLGVLLICSTQSVLSLILNSHNTYLIDELTNYLEKYENITTGLW